MSSILYPAGLYRTRWSEDSYGEQPSFKYLVLVAEVEGVKCYDIASMHKLIENLKEQRITNPYIIYSGVHLPEGNTGALRRTDLHSPHLIRIMKDVRDWPVQAVVALLVEKGISQLLLEDEVLGQADVKGINFEKVVQHVGFVAAINRKKRGSRGGFITARQKPRPKRNRPKANYSDVVEVRSTLREAPRHVNENMVWFERGRCYVRADSEEGRALLEENQPRDPEELVNMDPERVAAKLGKYMHEHIAERKKKIKKSPWRTEGHFTTMENYAVQVAAEVESDEVSAEEQKKRSSWAEAYKVAIVEDESQFTSKQKHLMAALDIALGLEEEEIEQDVNPEDVDGFEDAYEDEEVDW